MFKRGNHEFDSALEETRNNTIDCNIFKRQCNIIIPRGYETCPNCEGYGCLYVSAHFKHREVLVYKCPICSGNGYVDWITKLRNKKIGLKELGSITIEMKSIRFRCNYNGCKRIKRWVRDNMR